MHTTPRILRGLDDARRPVVRAEIVRRPGVFVTMDESDYDQLIAERGPRRFYLIQTSPGGVSYVRIKQHDVVGRLAQVSRIVANARPGQIVSYRNQDRLDLRRSNLALSSGRAKGQTSRIDEFSGLTVEQRAAARKQESSARASLPA